jgi:hypothetical protein
VITETVENKTTLKIKGLNKIPCPSRLSPKLFMALKEYTEVNGITRNSVIEKALQEFLKRKKIKI